MLNVTCKKVLLLLRKLDYAFFSRFFGLSLSRNWKANVAQTKALRLQIASQVDHVIFQEEDFCTELTRAQ